MRFFSLFSMAIKSGIFEWNSPCGGWWWVIVHSASMYTPIRACARVRFVCVCVKISTYTCSLYTRVEYNIIYIIYYICIYIYIYICVCVRVWMRFIIHYLLASLFMCLSIYLFISVCAHTAVRLVHAHFTQSPSLSSPGTSLPATLDVGSSMPLSNASCSRCRIRRPGTVVEPNPPSKPISKIQKGYTYDINIYIYI